MVEPERTPGDYALGLMMMNASLETNGVGDNTRYFVSGEIEMGIGLSIKNNVNFKTRVRIEIPEFIYECYEREILKNKDNVLRLSGDLTAKIEVPCIN